MYVNMIKFYYQISEAISPKNIVQPQTSNNISAYGIYRFELSWKHETITM